MVGRLVQRKWGEAAAVIAAISLFASFASAQRAENDWLIVPGERVGPISAEITESALQSSFGSENVEFKDIYLGEGFSQAGAVIFPDDESMRLEILWTDGDRNTLDAVRITGESSSWSTAEGISLGTSLKELEALNGFPFRLAGFDFDYGGTITDCGRGRLAMLGCSEGPNQSAARQIVLRLRPGADANGLPERRQVLGDRIFSSGHPAMQALNPRVYQIIVLIEGDTD